MWSPRNESAWPRTPSGHRRCTALPWATRPAAAAPTTFADAVRRRLHAFVRRGMCDGRRATLRLPPLCCAFPAAGEIDGHVSPDPLGGSQRPHLGEMLGLELLALGGGQL